MAEVISGKELSLKKRDFMKNQVEMLENKYGRKPHLAVILVGDDPGSVSHVTGKEKACNEIGITNTTIKKPNDITQEELLEIIEELNNNKSVDGILVQLPLPKHISDKKIIEKINPDKDVDCFHPINVGKMSIGDFDFDKSMLPCTPKGCVKLLKSVLKEDLSGKKVCIVGRSNIVGKPISMLLLNENCTVKIVHSKTKDLKSECLWADILVVAIGKPRFIKRDMIKDNAIIIDVGINRVGDKLCGDVDFDDVVEKISYITPVPGGVGPMTVACLMENVYNAFLLQNNY